MGVGRRAGARQLAGRSAYAFTICAALKADSGPACTRWRWPFSTGRNIGPVQILPTASHVCSASVGRSGRRGRSTRLADGLALAPHHPLRGLAAAGRGE
jgi:hypothetical protein